MPSTSEPSVGTDRWVLSLRPSKAVVDPWRPHAFLVEPERTKGGTVEDVATLFLTNRECPFRCLMCDLWKHTTDRRVPDGAIAAQVEWALTQLPPARHIKLYNAGNFFDAQAIPPADLPRVAELLRPFATVIVECHPLLVGRRCLDFRDLIQPIPTRSVSEDERQPSLTLRVGVGPALQVAMGLETIHPDVLPRLNKRMTLADFERATRFLVGHSIDVRAFLLLRPPFLSEAEGITWAKRSLEYAFDQSVECCVVIPTRAGNGAMERLQEQGQFAPPRLESLEEVLAFGVGLGRGRVFADLWDVEKLFDCPRCGPARARRLHAMNLTQTVPPPIPCECRTGT